MRFSRRGLIVLPAAALALAGWLLTGCGQRPASPTASAPTPADRPVELVAVSAQGFERAVQERRGKVVFVDAWFLG